MCMKLPRFRFSLRTFVGILVLLTIVVGGMLAWSRAIDRRVARMQRHGCYVGYEWEYHAGFHHDDELEEELRFRRAITAFRNFIDRPYHVSIRDDIPSANIDVIVDEMAQLGTFESVHISCDAFNSDHAKVLARLPRLKNAWLNSDGLTADGAQALMNSRSLKFIRLGGCQSIGFGAEQLQTISPNVEFLDLPTGVPSNDIERLRLKFPDCEVPIWADN